MIARTDRRVVARRAPLAQTRVLRGPLRFFAQDVDPCGGMPLARITGESPRDFAPLEPPGPGWKFIKNGSKSGWEYDASDSVGAALEHMPSIKFTVRFGARPTLGVAALRSYENFGAGLAWVGDDDAPAGGGSRRTPLPRRARCWTGARQYGQNPTHIIKAGLTSSSATKLSSAHCRSPSTSPATGTTGRPRPIRRTSPR